MNSKDSVTCSGPNAEVLGSKFSVAGYSFSVVRRSPDLSRFLHRGRAHAPTEGITPHHSITPPPQVRWTINHEPF